jgi:hypothetical protein
VLVLDMIEILPPLGVYKYDTWRIVIPRSEKVGPKPLYMCLGCSNHTYSNNMIIISNV